MKRQQNTRLNARVPKRLLRDAKRRARKQGGTLSSLVREALELYLARVA